jgi:hypothetical protein
MSTEAVYSYGFLLVVIGGVVAYVTWCCSRSKSILRHWAEDSGFEIMDSRLQPLSNGAFDWISSNGQTIYHVRIRDREGRERSGWVRCGSFWSGVLSDKTEVKWESESR